MILEGLTFDDVLLVPKYSTVESRSKIDISVKWSCLHYEHPIIPANMQTVTGKDMAIQIIKSGGLAILHRFMDEKVQLDIAKFIVNEHGNENFAVSIGVKESHKNMVDLFYKEGVRIVCIDIAHGDSQSCVDMIKWIHTWKPSMTIIAGNVSTGAGAERLWRAGADVVKVGVGPGSLCTTRIETGNGVPQLTALMEVADVRKKLTSPHREFVFDNSKNEDGCVINARGTIQDVPPVITKPIYVIADGGIKSAGDIVKALCFADMVMVGNLFAGCEETPGKMMVVDGITYKEYVGSSTHKTNHVEGVAALVRPKGTFKSVLEKLVEGVRSGCSYQGAHNLEELRNNPTFVRITNAGLKESHPHDVIVR